MIRPCVKFVRTKSTKKVINLVRNSSKEGVFTNEDIGFFAFICLMIFRAKFTYDGNPSDEFSVLDRNPSSNINTTIVSLK